MSNGLLYFKQSTPFSIVSIVFGKVNTSKQSGYSSSKRFLIVNSLVNLSTPGWSGLQLCYRAWLNNYNYLIGKTNYAK